MQITIGVVVESGLREVLDGDEVVLILEDEEMAVRTPTSKHLRHPTTKNYGPLSRLQSRMRENSDSMLR
jgi:hypothetical protein